MSRTQEFVRYSKKKSEEVYRDAELLAENSRWGSCINRLYYSSFYLISALLFQCGIKAETHSGVKTQFFLHFVKSGRINKEYGKLYSHLFDWRQETDYAAYSDFDGETVIPLLGQVKALNLQIASLLSTSPEK